MTRLRSTLLPAVFLASTLHAAVGDWHSWSDFNPVKALTEHQGKLYAGTLGGVRAIDPITSEEKDYDNLSGLTDVRIVGLAVDPEGRLWAASRSGGLYRLEGSTWSAWGRSYQSAGWTINDRAFFAAGPYLVLGTAKGLSFFDRRSKMAAVNLTRFGPEGETPITGLLRRGDTLYIATGKAVLQAPVDWENVLSSKYGAVYDPQIWKRSTGIASPLDLAGFADAGNILPVDTLSGDTVGKPDLAQAEPVHLDFLEGKVVAHARGSLLKTGPYRARAMPGRLLFVNGQALPDTNFESLGTAGGQLFMGSPFSLLGYSKEVGWRVITPDKSYPKLSVGAVSALGGKVSVHTPFKVWSLEGEEWKERLDPELQSPEVLMNELRNVRLMPGGKMYLGTWGKGVIYQGPDGKTKSWDAVTDSVCLPAAAGRTYTVVQSMDIRGNDMWIALLVKKETEEDHVHKLTHLDLSTGKVTCPEFMGLGSRATQVRILGDNLLGVAGEAGINLYRWEMRDGRVTGAPLSSFEKGTGDVLGRDVAYDSRGRLWGLFSEQLGYVDSVEDRIKKPSMPVKFPANVKVKTCRDMETDARGEFWVGCDNGLFHVRPGADPENPEVTQYTSTSGLLSNRVLDVSVDPITGDVWVVSEGGINRLEGPSPPLATGTSGIRAYPNPFLARHNVLVIDGLPQGSGAEILTQGGSVVRSFRSADMRGNQYQWDGTNAAGRKVKPGVYFWRVDSDGKSSRGKIIVAR